MSPGTKALLAVLESLTGLDAATHVPAVPVSTVRISQLFHAAVLTTEQSNGSTPSKAKSAVP